MVDKKIFCQNCGFELDEGSKVCNRCNVVATINLENYLLSKYKLLTIIGIFGALSVYLSTTSSTQGGNEFLQYGSYISLAIVILLSFIWGWGLIRYSFTILQFPFDGGFYFRQWFERGFQFSLIVLFMSFFASVILLISFYILTRVEIAEALIYSIFMDFFLLMIITGIYYPYRSLIETSGNGVRLIMNFLLVLIFFYTVQQFSTDTTSKWPFILVQVFLIILNSYLIFRCSALIYLDINTGVRSLTIENFKKSAKKMDQILVKLNNIREELKTKNEPDPVVQDTDKKTGE